MNIDDFFDAEEEIRMLDDQYRFRAWLREVGINDRNARQQFKNDLSS